MRVSHPADENILMALSPSHRPQLAKLPGPSQTDVSGSEWIRERKWDGMRAVFVLTEASTGIFSRTGQDLRPQFPELCDLHSRVGVSCVLDGEVVALTPGTDTEDLERLQLRLGDKLARRREEIPVEVRFFDLLEIVGRPTVNNTLAERRSLLGRLLQDTEWEEPETLADGAEIPSHWEGIIAKRCSSTYAVGKRNSDWRKFKFTQRATLRVTGLTAGKGSRSDSFGAVVVEDENGVPRGQIGSGFSDAQIAEILGMGAFFIGSLVEVEYRFLSKTGLMVNTAYKGLRHDKEAADVL